MAVGRRVFKHLHRLDVGWVDARERVECGTTRYGRGRHFAVVHVDKCAVYHIKRLRSGVDGVVSADNHVYISTQFARRSRSFTPATLPAIELSNDAELDCVGLACL